MKVKTKFKQTEIGMIPEDWDITPLKYLGEVKTGKGITNLDKGEYPIIGSNGIIGYTTEFLENSCLIYTGRVGTIGTVNYLQKSYVWLSDNVLYFKTDNLSLLKFIYYYLKLIDFTYLNVGSTQPLIKQSDFQELNICIPRFELEQQAIAKILSDLDEKIELNKKMNSTLEEIGKTLFKRWFIDFEFPNEKGEPYKLSGGEMVYNEELKKEIPKRWRADKLDEFATIYTGKGLKQIELCVQGKFNVIGANGIIGKTNNYLFDKKLIITGRVGTLGSVYLVNKKIWISDNVLIIDPKIDNYYYYLYFNIIKFDFSSLNRGSTQPLLTQTDLKNQYILNPSNEIIIQFNKHLSDIFNLINVNNNNCISLTETRDSLLPKLMSGKIRVPIEARI